jgi:hypothetical protein
MNNLEASYQPRAITVETQEEATRRLREELPVLPPDAEAAPGVVDMHLVHHKLTSGYQYWSQRYSEPGEDVARVMDPNAGEYESAKEYVKAQDGFYQHVLTAADGRWWQGSKAEQRIGESLREVYQGRAYDDAGTEKTIDILNCADSDLTEEELASMQEVLTEVGNYTKGKIFSRMRGIVFLPDSDFEDKDLGGFQFASGVMRLNLDEFRAGAGALPPRYQRYFQGRTDVDTPKIVFAHELGHVMDLTTTDEVDALFIDKDQHGWMAMGGRTGDFSAFNRLPGWKHQVVEDDKGFKKDVWNFDVTSALEEAWGETPPTNYGQSKPHEDTGESFAIDSLGGDMSTLRMRQKVLHEMIKNAVGDEMGPLKFTVAKSKLENDIYRTNKLKGLRLKLYEAIEHN